MGNEALLRLRTVAAALRRDRTLAAAVSAAGLPPDLVSIADAAMLAGVTEKAIRERIRLRKVTRYGSYSTVLVPLSAVVDQAQHPRTQAQNDAGRRNLERGRMIGRAITHPPVDKGDSITPIPIDIGTIGAGDQPETQGDKELLTPATADYLYR